MVDLRAVIRRFRPIQLVISASLGFLAISNVYLAGFLFYLPRAFSAFLDAYSAYLLLSKLLISLALAGFLSRYSVAYIAYALVFSRALLKHPRIRWRSRRPAVLLGFARRSVRRNQTLLGVGLVIVFFAFLHFGPLMAVVFIVIGLLILGVIYLTFFFIYFRVSPPHYRSFGRQVTMTKPHGVSEWRWHAFLLATGVVFCLAISFLAGIMAFLSTRDQEVMIYEGQTSYRVSNVLPSSSGLIIEKSDRAPDAAGSRRSHEEHCCRQVAFLPYESVERIEEITDH
jgi:hypothetical protein